MKAMIRVFVILILAIPSARAEGLPKEEQVAERGEVSRRTELGKLLSVVEYDQRIGKIAKARLFCAKAEKLEAAKRIYLRVKSNAVSRRETLQMEELITKSIMEKTHYTTVGSFEAADMILEVELKPVGHTSR